MGDSRMRYLWSAFKNKVNNITHNCKEIRFHSHFQLLNITQEPEKGLKDLIYQDKTTNWTLSFRARIKCEPETIASLLDMKVSLSKIFFSKFYHNLFMEGRIYETLIYDHWKCITSYFKIQSIVKRISRFQKVSQENGTCKHLT